MQMLIKESLVCLVFLGNKKEKDELTGKSKTMKQSASKLLLAGIVLCSAFVSKKKVRKKLR